MCRAMDIPEDKFIESRNAIDAGETGEAAR